jgi:hypothetical protein
MCSLDIVVSRVTEFLQGKRDFSSPEHPLQPPIPNIAGALSEGIKRLGSEAEHI